MEINIPSLDDVTFEQACSRCEGYGWAWHTRNLHGKALKAAGAPRMIPCPVCGGTGVQMSPVGYELVKFLKTYYRLEPVAAPAGKPQPTNLPHWL